MQHEALARGSPRRAGISGVAFVVAAALTVLAGRLIWPRVALTDFALAGIVLGYLAHMAVSRVLRMSDLRTFVSDLPPGWSFASCPSCGYDQAGTSSDDCPECGCPVRVPRER